LTDKNFDRQNFDRREFRPIEICPTEFTPTIIFTDKNFDRQNFDRQEFSPTRKIPGKSGNFLEKNLKLSYKNAVSLEFVLVFKTALIEKYWKNYLH
jgi:hypothetical protein